MPHKTSFPRSKRRMKRQAAAVASNNSFIPGLTSGFVFDAINAKGFAFTMSRKPSQEQGVYLFLVSDLRKETHTVKFTMKYPRLEDFSDLACTCTCAEFNIHTQWGTYCDHVLCALGEVIDPEAEKHVKVGWGEWSSPKKKHLPAQRRQIKKVLEDAKPEDVMKRLLAMAEEDDDDAVDLIAKLFPEQDDDDNETNAGIECSL